MESAFSSLSIEIVDNEQSSRTNVQVYGKKHHHEFPQVSSNCKRHCAVDEKDIMSLRKACKFYRRATREAQVENTRLKKVSLYSERRTCESADQN